MIFYIQYFRLSNVHPFRFRLSSSRRAHCSNTGTSRDHARLLVYNRANGTVTDDFFYNLGNYLPKNSTLVVNNSKVEKCRLLFDDGKRELFVTSVRNNNTIEALVRPGRKFKFRKKVELVRGIYAKLRM